MRILPGMYADAETGLYYNMARYCDPRVSAPGKCDWPVMAEPGRKTSWHARVCL